MGVQILPREGALMGEKRAMRPFAKLFWIPVITLLLLAPHIQQCVKTLLSNQMKLNHSIDNFSRFMGGYTNSPSALEYAEYLHRTCWMLMVLRQTERSDVIRIHAVRMHASSQYVDEHLSLNTTRTRYTAPYRPIDVLHRSPATRPYRWQNVLAFMIWVSLFRLGWQHNKTQYYNKPCKNIKQNIQSALTKKNYKKYKSNYKRLYWAVSERATLYLYVSAINAIKTCLSVCPSTRYTCMLYPNGWTNPSSSRQHLILV